MKRPEQIAENIWTFPIVLPDNPLKWLNCFVIKGSSGQRNLLIDTGFNRTECFSDLVSGMKALKISPEETDIFITHLHSDHTGNAAVLQSMGCRVYMSQIDYLRQSDPENFFINSRMRALSEGVPAEVFEAIFDHNPALQCRPGKYVAETCEEGKILSYGGYELKCILTPGHTPGHMALYEEKHEIMFLGDHVLFDITPNICAWHDVKDSLGDYMKSLEKIRGMKVRLSLPAHRNSSECSLSKRIDELLLHHENRLKEIIKVISITPGLSAYDIAGQMSWRIRATGWDTFPETQKYFAFSETLAHLDYLVDRKIVNKKLFCGTFKYMLVNATE